MHLVFFRRTCYNMILKENNIIKYKIKEISQPSRTGEGGTIPWNNFAKP